MRSQSSSERLHDRAVMNVYRSEMNTQLQQPCSTWKDCDVKMLQLVCCACCSRFDHRNSSKASYPLLKSPQSLLLCCQCWQVHHNLQYLVSRTCRTRNAGCSYVQPCLSLRHPHRIRRRVGHVAAATAAIVDVALPMIGVTGC